MSDLRALLRDAAPAVPDGFDPDDAHRRVVRRRRTRRVAASLGLLLVAVGAAVLAWPGAGPDEERVDVVDDGRRAEQRSLVDIALPGPARDVAAGEGAVWVAGSDDDGAGWYLARLDPATGDVATVVELERVVRRVVVGDGTVWAFGGGDGGEPDGGIVAIDAATAEIIGTYGYADRFSPYDMAITEDGAAVRVSDATGHRVLRFEASSPLAPSAEVAVGGQADDVVAADDGTLWVRRSLEGEIVGVDTTAAEVVATASWEGGLLAPADEGAVWAGDGDRVVELTPRLLDQGQSVALGERVDVRSNGAHVVVDADGLWVGGPDGLARFEDSTATLRLPGYDVWGLAVDGSSVWFVDLEGRLRRWTAAEPPPRALMWTRDRRTVVVDTRSGAEVREIEGDDLVRVGPDGETLTIVDWERGCAVQQGSLATADVADLGVDGLDALLSPDRSRLAYVRCGTDAPELVVRHLATGAEASVAMAGYIPTWHPDGRRVVVALPRGDDDVEYALVDADEPSIDAAPRIAIPRRTGERWLVRGYHPRTGELLAERQLAGEPSRLAAIGDERTRVLYVADDPDAMIGGLDPSGRYLLVVEGTGVLSSVDLETGAATSIASGVQEADW